VKSIFEIQLKDGASKSLDKIVGKVKEVTKQLNTFEKALGKTISATTNKIVTQQKELRELEKITNKISGNKTGKGKKNRETELIPGLQKSLSKAEKLIGSFVKNSISKINTLKNSLKSIPDSINAKKAKKENPVNSSSESPNKSDTKNTLKEKGDEAKKDVDSVSGKMGQFKSIVTGVADICGNVFDRIIGHSTELKTKWENLKNGFNNGLDKILETTFGPFISNAIDLANRILPSVLTAIENLGVKLQPLMTQIGDFANVVLPPLVNAVITIIEFIADHTNTIIALAGAWGLLNLAIFFNTGLFEGLTFAEGLLMVQYILMEGVTTGLTLAQTALNTVMSLSPIGWLALAIGGIIIVIGIFADKVGGVGNAFKVLWAELLNFGSNVLDLISRIFGPFLDAINFMSEGKWAEAALAFGKGIFNITGGWAVEVVSWVRDGSATKAVGDATSSAAEQNDYNKGKGPAFQLEQGTQGPVIPAPNNKASAFSPFYVPPAKTTNESPSNSVSPKDNGQNKSGGSNSGTNITIRIENLVKELIIQSVDGGIPVADITKQISHALIAAVNDSQITV